MGAMGAAIRVGLRAAGSSVDDVARSVATGADAARGGVPDVADALMASGGTSASARGGQAAAARAGRIAPADDAATGTSLVSATSTTSSPAEAKAALLAELQAMQVVRSVERPAITAPENLVHRVRDIARHVGRGESEVRDAIHAAKRNGMFGGSSRNPDVLFDPASGELYPRLAGGKAGPDAVGNIFDHLL